VQMLCWTESRGGNQRMQALRLESTKILLSADGTVKLTTRQESSQLVSVT